MLYLVYGSVNPVPVWQAGCHLAASRVNEMLVMLRAEQRLFGTWAPFCVWSDAEKLSESLMLVTRCGVPIRLNMHGLRSPVIWHLEGYATAGADRAFIRLRPNRKRELTQKVIT